MVGLPYPNLKSPELKEKMEYLNTHMVSVTCSAPHSKLACSTVALFIHVMFGISMISYWPCFITNFKFRMMIAIILLLHQYWGRKGEGEGREKGREVGSLRESSSLRENISLLNMCVICSPGLDGLLLQQWE